MKVQSLSEELLFNTVKLSTMNGSGTGFFFCFEIQGVSYPILITNQHVVEWQKHCAVTFRLHLGNANAEPLGNLDVKFGTDWIFHSTKDLCFCFVNPLFDYVKNVLGKDVFYRPVGEHQLISNTVLESLCALEEVSMIGYPIGLSDEYNNLPIFRRGYTASHPKYDFNNEAIGLVDMACFPGSSGSPIFIHNENGYTDASGNTFLGAKRLILLGILFGGPQYAADGSLTISTIPTSNVVKSQTQIPTNLGYYIKASEIFEFKEYIQKNIVEKGIK